MDSLFNILSSKDFSLPEEAKAIKEYVSKKYDQQVSVAVSTKEIIISSQSAGLISSLRLNSPDLARAAKTTKRIRFRIG